MTYYHETERRNLKSIRENGLAGKHGKPLYLTTIEPCDGNLITLAEKWAIGMVWLAVEIDDDSDFREDPEFARLMPETAYMTRRTIPWSKITVIKP